MTDDKLRAALDEVVGCLRRIEDGGPLKGDAVSERDWIEWAQTDAYASLTHPVVTAALAASATDEPPCRGKSDDRWLCETHPGGMFSGQYSGGGRCSLAASAPDEGRLPSDPDPNAVEVSPGSWLHWGLYLRGAASAPDEGPWWRETGVAISEDEHAVYLTNEAGDSMILNADDVAVLVNARPAAPAALDVDRMRHGRRAITKEWLGPCCAHPEPGCVTCGFVPEEPTDD